MISVLENTQVIQRLSSDNFAKRFVGLFAKDSFVVARLCRRMFFVILEEPTQMKELRAN